MLSKNTRTNRCKKGLNTSFINAWKVADAFVSPNGVTKNSKSPWFVWNAVEVHPNLVVACSKVELGEELGVAHLIEQFLDDGDGEFVLNGLGIQCAIVDAKMPRIIRFPDEKNRH
jgi:hypothetical protein